jgi:integrase/recombinase XerD
MKHLPLYNNTFIQLENGYKEWLGILGYNAFNVYSMPTQVREFLHYLENNGITRIEQVSTDTVNHYFDYLKTRKKERNPGVLSNNTLNSNLQSIKRFSDYLRNTGKAGFITDIIAWKQIFLPRVVLHPKEIAMLYDVTENTPYGIRDKAMMGIYYGCGLRRNEGLQLDLNDILFDRQLVYVRAGKNYTERYVPANEQVLQDINQYIQQARPSLLVRNNTEPALFIGQRGNRPEAQSLYLRLKKLQDNTGEVSLQNKDIGLHTLRHSIATHLLMEGMKLERIAQFLGHKSIESTQIYTHLAHELQSIPSAAQLLP